MVKHISRIFEISSARLLPSEETADNLVRIAFEDCAVGKHDPLWLPCADRLKRRRCFLLLQQKWKAHTEENSSARRMHGG